ncbi:hypothetical protein Snoj_32660 [Streptomyces nojiriensis]|uniref:Uncharacterized protein n=1 Tax=Streptomyces nojiriensis TaxID=66374 RepID=A0ABQ3SMJ6_9ACTN|nr:hypothetical protein [Streptomyces nojiriensis]QTI42917.1 hypothetical protein JYK04_00678 [Streptomyces nojiriensis]GGS33260.1 hypothetical protein GCM10010205_74350 [Streptomyces nojiriensis]GHI69348.1 hypothetical protein Snoj_32660 [Streptomyces nojiriensis]
MSTHTPPPSVVARDPHWAAKMQRLRSRRLAERTLSICDDPTLKAAVTEAALGLARARTEAQAASIEQGITESARSEWVAQRPEVLAAEGRLADAQKELDQETERLTFRALPRPAWEQLLREHPPTEAQADAGMEYNVETFPAALIAACHIERDAAGAEVPSMTEADAQELLDSWADADAKALFTTALVVNQTIRADLGKG